MIFWKHIKGLTEQTVNNEVKQLYSFLKFSEAVHDGSYDAQFLPEIHINNVNSTTGTDVRNLGKIITSQAQNQTIEENLRFGNNVKVFFGTANSDPSYEISELYYDSGTTPVVEWRNRKQLKIEVFNDGATAQSGNFSTFKMLYNSIIWYIANSEKATLDENSFTLTVPCNSPYFNATSDKRAKINIKPLSISALELVEKTPLYSFKYKDSDLPSIGIIAQDVQDINIEGFKLVDNEQASGKDYDYMSIHESKLTYILWKAVQEQQALIKDLQAQINELKKN